MPPAVLLSLVQPFASLYTRLATEQLQVRPLVPLAAGGGRSMQTGDSSPFPLQGKPWHASTLSAAAANITSRQTHSRRCTSMHAAAALVSSRHSLMQPAVSFAYTKPALQLQFLPSGEFGASGDGRSVHVARPVPFVQGQSRHACTLAPGICTQPLVSLAYAKPVAVHEQFLPAGEFGAGAGRSLQVAAPDPLRLVHALAMHAFSSARTAWAQAVH